MPTTKYADFMMLHADKHIIGMVHLYAQRRGIKNSDALRRIVRTGLGLDPVGEGLDERSGKKRDLRRTLNKTSIKRERKHKVAIPAHLQSLFEELKPKVGAIEARRLVHEHQQLKQKGI